MAESSDPDAEEQFIPRPYQDQLEEIAVSKNTIIHLPTGSGKTFIAARLINRFRHTLKKPWGQGGKRTFFLVCTVPLVKQQKNVIKKMCAVKSVAGYTGEDGVDYWEKEKWDAELVQHEVIVMTSQILADMLTHLYIKIEDINLLIFDECHHAVEDHPMRLIMKHFHGCPPDKQPRVLGLTATLLNANVSIGKVPQSLQDLETTFHATIATVNELGEVLNYSTNPNEVIKFHRPCRLSEAANEAKKVLHDLVKHILNVKLPKVSGDPSIKLEKTQRDISSDPKKIVKEVKNMVENMIFFIHELGVYGGALSILAYIILLERLKRKAISKEEEKLYTFTITHSVMARAILLKSMENDEGYEKIIKHSSEKVIQLLNILKEYNPDLHDSYGGKKEVNKLNQPLSGIIFTRQRFTAKILYNLLKDVKEANPIEFGFLKHDFLVGFNINPYKSTREQLYTKKSSETTLLKFCKEELNCLLATSVIEEGVDIRQCLLVLRYDPPLEYRSYIQSKGRARSRESNYVILVSEEDRERFNALYSSFQRTESYIQNMLVGNTDDRKAPSNRRITTELYDEDFIAPYIAPSGARLSAVQAISLLNRYCSVLAHDRFTTIYPMWIKEDVKDASDGAILQQVKIYMPISSPVKEIIEGRPVPSIKDAKRSAALNACIRLHQEGELDPDTLLPRLYGTVDFDDTNVRECFLNWPWDGEQEKEDLPKAGTKKRMRKHPKMFPVLLKGKSSWSGTQKFYLHVIDLKTAFQEPTDPRDKALYTLLRRKEGFGFMTMQPLPKLCDFPMFLKVGEVTCSLKMNYAAIPIDMNLFELIKCFHHYIFDQVLDVLKKFTVFDGTQNAAYVVLLKPDDDGFDIDWQGMQLYDEIPPLTEPSAEERRMVSVTEETYKYSVVTPWYRDPILPSRYIVSNVLEYKSPKSLFDPENPCLGTFADYYSNKYNLDILGNKEQPLLEVANISSRMNCLLPRAVTIKALTDKQKKMIALAQGDDKPQNFTEELIPEFCIKYDFPGVLWYKAMMLPSILHRVFMLLVAYELRAEIATATGIGTPNLPQGKEWTPIEVNPQKVQKALLSLIEDTPAPSKAIDRINNPIDEAAPRPPKPMTLKDSIYKLKQKKLSEEYNWDEKSEPLDIERNISTVTVMDIECYDEFVSMPVAPMDSVSRSPKRDINTPVNRALLPPPLRAISKIGILAKKSITQGPELRDVLAALTTTKSSDAFDLERVETLGDSFLKFAASLYLYHKFPKLSEGQLTNIKGRLIGNRNLYYAGVKVQLGGRMKVEHFSPRNDFLVPGFLVPMEIQKVIEKKGIRPTCLIGIEFPPEEILSGKLSGESKKVLDPRISGEEGTVEQEPEGNAQMAMQCFVRSQAVSDKSIADCVEGLIGTYLLSNGIVGAVKVLEWLKVFPEKDNFTAMLSKQISTPIKEGLADAEEINRIMNNCREEVEQTLNYRFKDPSYLLEALSHPSYIRNRLTRSYERLEFLGDAILDFLVTSHIFENCPDLKPGELTDLRSALVNNVTFAAYVVRLGLHKFMCYQLNPSLENAIMEFIDHQETRGHAIVEDVLYLIEEEDCSIAEYVEVPKVLSDIFESLAGAIYLDSGGDLSAVWAVYYRIMCREIHEFSLRVPLQPVRCLYEHTHACPSFSQPLTVESSASCLPRVMVGVRVTRDGTQHLAHGFGANKSQAKRAAAKIALKFLTM